MRTYAVSVKAGAKLLDEVRPDWFNELSLFDLDMDDLYACVLGQLYGRYGRGLTTLFPAASSFHYQCILAVAHGFDIKTPHVFSKYERLTQLWIQEVLDRRAKDLYSVE